MFEMYTCSTKAHFNQMPTPNVEIFLHLSFPHFAQRNIFDGLGVITVTTQRAASIENRNVMIHTVQPIFG